MCVSVCVWVCFAWEVGVCFVLRFLLDLFLTYLHCCTVWWLPYSSANVDSYSLLMSTRLSCYVSNYLPFLVTRLPFFGWQCCRACTYAASLLVFTRLSWLITLFSCFCCPFFVNTRGRCHISIYTLFLLVFTLLNCLCLHCYSCTHQWSREDGRVARTGSRRP